MDPPPDPGPPIVAPPINSKVRRSRDLDVYFQSISSMLRDSTETSVPTTMSVAAYIVFRGWALVVEGQLDEWDMVHQAMDQDFEHKNPLTGY
jgi:hypothetical protein